MLGQPFRRYEFKNKRMGVTESKLIVERQGIPRSGTVYFSICKQDESRGSHELFGIDDPKDLRKLAELLLAYADTFEKEYPTENLTCECAIYKRALELACKPVATLFSTPEGWLKAAKDDLK